MMNYFLCNFFLCIQLFLFSGCCLSYGDNQGIAISDSGRLYETHIEEYYRPETVSDLQQMIQTAALEQKTISFAAQRYSQGGHTFCDHGIVVDMRSLNQILKIDPIEKVILVQAGATWEEVQNAVNEYGLALKVMQASNIFSVGGSLSVNAHGRDARYGTLIETIRSIKVIKADGTIVLASREENGDLFRAVIGGYGAFGAIVEAEIELTDNHIYQKSAEVVLVENYPSYFKDRIFENQNVGLHFARMNLSSNCFLREVIAVSYLECLDACSDISLEPEKHITLNKIQLFLLRHFNFVKSLRWPLEVRTEMKEKVLTRNQAMRPPVKCLSYRSSKRTDILQEYFIPLDQFSKFVGSLRKIAEREKINLLNVTIRYVPKDCTSLLPYAKEDSFAFVLYVTQGLSEKEREKAIRWTRLLIDAALECRGTYYLPYQLYATQKQFETSYPEREAFIQMKKFYDPNHVFSNNFYDAYFSSKNLSS